MGIVCEVSCFRCSYLSDEMRLGSGMLGGDATEELVCTDCRLLFAGTASVRRDPSPWPLSFGDSHGQCPRCDALCAAAYVNHAPPFPGSWMRSDGPHVQCPKCGSLDTERRTTGLWD